jgi:TonB family protein
VAVLGGAVAVFAGVGVVMMSKKPAPAAVTSTATLASSLPTAPSRTAQQVLGDSVVLSGNSTTPATTTMTATAGLDPEAQKKAFEKAVQQQLEAQMLALQTEYNRKLQKEQSKDAPAIAAPVLTASNSNDDHTAPSAAQLDSLRRESARDEAPALPAVRTPEPQQQQQQPAVVQASQPAVQPPPQTAVAAVQEGDVIDMFHLDTPPVATKLVKPNYPSMAAQQKAQATIILSALVSERGEVIDVHVLSGDKRFGLQDAAIRALRATRFSPAMKDGKRVRTWMPRTYVFKP